MPRSYLDVISGVAHAGMGPSTVGTGTCHPSDCLLSRALRARTGPRVVLGSGAWHIEFLPITTHCRRTAREEVLCNCGTTSDTVQLSVPPWSAALLERRARNCPLMNSAVNIGSCGVESHTAT